MFPQLLHPQPGCEAHFSGGRSVQASGVPSQAPVQEQPFCWPQRVELVRLAHCFTAPWHVALATKVHPCCVLQVCAGSWVQSWGVPVHSHQLKSQMHPCCCWHWNWSKNEKHCVGEP